MTIAVDRARVVAYRVAAQQLDRPLDLPAVPADRLAVLDIGVQDTPYGSAALAVSARGGRPADAALSLIWSVRGAPHLHRRADLPALAAALWPLSDADATSRINVTPIKEGAKLGIAAFTAAAVAMHDVVTGPMSKGDVSTAVSARVPGSLTYWCRTCAAQHISGGLFQQVGVLAGVELDLAAGAGTWLAPVEDRPAVPTAAAGTADLIAAYLRLLGPATPAEAAKFLETTKAAARPAWPADLVEVLVDGRRTWLPPDRVDALREAPRPSLVRLLPPSDPYLQARDRDLIVPDPKRQKEVWRILGNPGVLMVDGEVAGTWRAKRASNTRLDVTVTPFEPLPARVRKALEPEAARLAEIRGTPRADLTVKS
jgi:hypothetical protein